MRVLLVHDEPIDAGYGAESYVRRLAAGLAAAGDEVALIAGEVQHRGISRALDLWDPSARRLVGDRAGSFRPDVINFHNISRELSASVLGAVPEIPSVLTVHDLRLLGGREHSATSARGVAEIVASGLIRRTAVRRISATIGVSDRVSDALRRSGFLSVSTVGVPVAEPVGELRPAGQCADLAIVARLAPDKGVDVAIAAFALMGDERGEARLLIAGDGPSRRELEASAASLGDRVQFLGRLDEAGVAALLGRVRGVVVASVPTRRPEGSSLALVEAAMHARPVLASDDPAVAELVARLGGAITVPAGDVGALATAMTTLLTDAARAQQLGSSGQVGAVRDHSIEAVTAATRAVYATAIAA